MISKRNFLRDLWDREETRIVLLLAAALVLSALFFCWSGGEQMMQPGGRLKVRPSGMIIIGRDGFLHFYCNDLIDL